MKGLINLLAKRATMTGFSIYDHLHRLPAWLPRMAELVRRGRVVYHQETWQGIDSVPEAFVSMLAGGNLGKRVVQVGDDPTLPSEPAGRRRDGWSRVFEVVVDGEAAVDVVVDGEGGASAHADALWEEGRALYVAESPGRLVIGFAERAAAEEAARRLGGAVVEVDVSGRGDLDAWRAWARPTRVGRLVVRPAWLPSGPLAPADVEIAVDPGHAFGHGGHPSTRLVLAALVERLGGGESVLDVGCGSGVLSIAAVALGAESVRAVDIDPTAVAVTRANALANGMSRRIDVDSTPAGSDSTSIRRRRRQHRRGGPPRAGAGPGRAGRRRWLGRLLRPARAPVGRRSSTASSSGRRPTLAPRPPPARPWPPAPPVQSTSPGSLGTRAGRHRS